jgi:hypothetical protein
LSFKKSSVGPKSHLINSGSSNCGGSSNSSSSYGFGFSSSCSSRWGDYSSGVTFAFSCCGFEEPAWGFGSGSCGVLKGNVGEWVTFWSIEVE